MTILLAASIALLAVMVVIATVNVLFAPRLHRFDSGGAGSASLLVPARNEADNLRTNLPAMLAQDPPPLEVLVLDDGSTDGTASVVESFADRFPTAVRLIRGAPLPIGWGGKNWACHQLAEQARGGLLIFCDADVRPAADAVGRTIGGVEQTASGVLTALPRHQFDSWLVAATVPMVAWLPAVALLPLPLVPRVRAPSLGMGNGQWLAFTRAAYAACGGHSAVRAEVLEDVALARRAKSVGVRLLVAAAPRTLQVRMYRDWREMRAGFGKNLYALGGGSAAGFAVTLAVFLLAAAAPLLAPITGATWAYAAPVMLLFVRACGAVLLGQGAATVLLHPIGVVVATLIAVESAVRGDGGVEWKGRRMPAAAPGGARGRGR